jgi:hypothetical protein
MPDANTLQACCKVAVMKEVNLDAVFRMYKVGGTMTRIPIINLS